MPRDLTQAKIDTLKRLGNHRVAKNLYVRVVSERSRSWAFRYFRHGRAHWLGLGSADLLTLDEAKTKSLEYRVLLRNGGDPLAEKQAAQPKAVPSFEACFLQYVSDHKDGWKNAKSEKHWLSTLPAYCGPINKRPVSAITPAAVAAVLRPIWLDRAETSRKLRSRIERVLSWAKVQGYRTGDNPATWDTLKHLLPSKKNKVIVKHHAALHWSEIPELVAELHKRESVSSQALLFTILTAARTEETIGATWAEIDLDAGLWVIGAARMKATSPHRVPLPASVIQILKGISRCGPDELIFVGERGKRLSNMAMLEMMRGLRGMGMTVHGLRASFKTWGSDTKQPRDAIEMSLAHKVGNAVERAYERTDLLELRREVMTAWADHCFNLQSGTAPRPPSLRRIGLASEKLHRTRPMNP